MTNQILVKRLIMLKFSSTYISEVIYTTEKKYYDTLQF